jgi:hypothetical protein
MGFMATSAVFSVDVVVEKQVLRCGFACIKMATVGASQQTQIPFGNDKQKTTVRLAALFEFRDERCVGH